MDPRGAHHDHGSSEHPHERKPIDLSYRIVVRTVLWLIVGAVILGFGIWWMWT